MTVRPLTYTYKTVGDCRVKADVYRPSECSASTAARPQVAEQDPYIADALVVRRSALSGFPTLTMADMKTVPQGSHSSIVAHSVRLYLLRYTLMSFCVVL